MVVFPLLFEPASYRACHTDLLLDEAARMYWLDLFESHFAVQLSAARDVGIDPLTCAAAEGEWLGIIAQLRSHPARYGRLDILLLDEIRGEVLRRHGIMDEFRLLKLRENRHALAYLPMWLQHLQSMPPADRIEAIIRGMLAGNLFDMGVKATAAQFAAAALPFTDALARVPNRPWRYDAIDHVRARWSTSSDRPRKAVIFADNAGADAILGVLPLAWELLRGGSKVVITANTTPSLNDITFDELVPLLSRAAEIDSTFESLSLSLVHNGSAAPLIDLAAVSDELAHASVGADLVILVGMGRGIESNWTARFTCETWRVAMLKDPQVARSVNGAMFDAVFRVDAPHQAIRT